MFAWLKSQFVAIKSSLFGRPKHRPLSSSRRCDVKGDRPIPMIAKGVTKNGVPKATNHHAAEKKEKKEKGLVKREEEEEENPNDDSSSEGENVEEEAQEQLYQVIRILKRRINKKGEEEYLVEWAPGNYPRSERLQWLPRKALKCPDLLSAFTRAHPRR